MDIETLHILEGRAFELSIKLMKLSMKESYSTALKKDIMQAEERAHGEWEAYWVIIRAHYGRNHMIALRNYEVAYENLARLRGV